MLGSMLAMDATPADAARFQYEAVAVYHCQLTVHLWLKGLPARPLREMRFRCQRCGESLSAEEAEARWTRHADAPGVPRMGQVLPIFDG